MKKIIAQVIIFLIVLAAFMTNVSAASFEAVLTTNKQKVRPGDEIELTFGVKDIDEDGISAQLNGKLQFNEDLFEPITSKNFTSLDGWAFGRI